MEKIKKGIIAILCLFAFYIFVNGIKYTFSTEKVYMKFGEDVFHSTKFCPQLGIDEMDKDYMVETGKIIKSEEINSQKVYNNLALEMCPFCYSPFDRKCRYEHHQEVYKDKYQEVKKRAIELRKKEIQDELRKKYPELYE